MRKATPFSVLTLLVLVPASFLTTAFLNSKGDLIMQSLTPNIMVHDVNKTIEYYGKHFGFKLVNSVPEDGQFDWAMVTAGNVSLMLQSKESLQQDVPALREQEPGGSLTFFVQVQGVDQLRKTLSPEVKVAFDLETKFYGMREFTIQDLNGYYVTFAERVE